jgi:hypothetical protein
MSKASIFMSASWIGLAGLVLALAGAMLPQPFTVVLIGLTVTFFATLVMLLARRADEFTLSLWDAGASVAFGTMLLGLPGLPFAEGFFDGVTGNESGRDIPVTIVPIFAVGAFYIGLFVKRLLGDA